MYVVTKFDPWNFELCTCGEKYSLNPYTGCAHKCLYCYATYIPNFFNVREKKDYFKKLEKDLEKLPTNAIISLSNSSDPYPIVEKNLKVTRRTLELLKEYGFKVMIVTKSDIVVRDVDLLSEMDCVVSISITFITKNDVELMAPPPEKRIYALKYLSDAGIKTVLRLDPLMPWINEIEWLSVIEKCAFVDHVVTSTLKLKRDAYYRLVTHAPHLKNTLNQLYIREGEKISSYYYLPKDVRMAMLSKVSEKCEELNLSYGYCREGIPFKARSCDGSYLLNK